MVVVVMVVMMMVVHFQQSRHTPGVFAHLHSAGGWLLDQTDCVTWEFGLFDFFFVFCPPSVIQAVSVERNWVWRLSIASLIFESEKLNFRYLGRCGHLNMMLLMSYSISSSLFSFASFECLPLNFGGVAHQNLGLGHQNRRLGISTVNFSSPRQSKRQNFSQFFILSSNFFFFLFQLFFIWPESDHWECLSLTHWLTD